MAGEGVMTKRQKRLDTLVDRHKNADMKFRGEPVTGLTRIEILAVLAEVQSKLTKLMEKE
jgi:hypothetical protein